LLELQRQLFAADPHQHLCVRESVNTAFLASSIKEKAGADRYGSGSHLAYFHLMICQE
jgi:hypothetical protein